MSLEARCQMPEAKRKKPDACDNEELVREIAFK
jgi:hypothetical protein